MACYGIAKENASLLLNRMVPLVSATGGQTDSKMKPMIQSTKKELNMAVVCFCQCTESIINGFR